MFPNPYKANIKRCLDTAQALSYRALEEGRELTPAERQQGETLLAEVAELRKQAEAYDQRQQDFADAIAKLEGTDRGDRATHGRKAWSWAAAVAQAVVDPYGRQKALTSGTVTVPSLSSTVVTKPDRPPTLMELLPIQPLDGSDRYAYLQETVKTNNAAPVAAGARKPVSVYTVAKVEDRARVIAHLTEPIPRQTLSDVALLKDYVSTHLYAGVIEALESQVIGGTGAGEQLTGIHNTGGIQTQAKGVDPWTDQARKAITKLQTANLGDGAGFVFIYHPTNWEAISLLRTADGIYIARSPDSAVPIDAAKQRLWGVPVAVTTAATVGTAHLVDLGSIQVWEREGVQVDWSENVYDSVAGFSDFEANQIRFRGEGRFGFAVLRPTGIVELTGL